jgi:hypothetical protein
VASCDHTARFGRFGTRIDAHFWDFCARRVSCPVAGGREEGKRAKARERREEIQSSPHFFVCFTTTTDTDPSIAQSVFAFFTCVSVPNDSVIALYPAVSCTSDSTYLALRPLFFILLILVVALPLLLFLRLYQLTRKGSGGKGRALLWSDAEVCFVYGPMHEAYPRNLYYWVSASESKGQLYGHSDCCCFA